MPERTYLGRFVDLSVVDEQQAVELGAELTGACAYIPIYFRVAPRRFLSKVMESELSVCKAL